MKYDPNVIFIGYMKAGTGFLRSYFTYHPEIQWTRKAMFFQLNDEFKKAKKHYISKIKHAFDGGGDFNNENKTIDVFEGLSTAYTTHSDVAWNDSFFDPELPIPENSTWCNPKIIAKRIKSILPETKILISLRNQVDWLRSNYLYHLNQLPSQRKKFSDFIKTFEGKNALTSIEYDQTLKTYFDIFDQENVHVILLEEFSEDETWQRLCEFLGVPYKPFKKEWGWQNEGRGIKMGKLHRWLSKFGLEAQDFPDPLRNLGSTVGRWLPLPGGEDVLSDEQISMIESFYAPHNVRASNILKKDLKKYGYPS